MSNIAKLYTDLTSGPPIEQPTGPDESLDAGLKQLKWNWVQSTITQEVFKELTNDEKELIDKAIGLATGQNNINVNLIIQLLTRVDTIRRLKVSFSNQQLLEIVKPTT